MTDSDNVIVLMLDEAYALSGTDTTVMERMEGIVSIVYSDPTNSSGVKRADGKVNAANYSGTNTN
jgi:hypothetical protein